MAVDLAVALVALTAAPAMMQLVRGEVPTGDDWAGVAGGIANALLTQTSDQSTALARIEQQVGALPAREYQQYMAAGRRFLHDLPVSWRKKTDRADIIRDARGEFVRASAVAQQMGDAYRTALAEVAIAGCWLWVPSLPDAQRTLGEARKILEEAVLNEAGPGMVRAYIDVLRLCQAYGEEPPALRAGLVWLSRDREVPADPATVPTVPAVLTVNAETGELVHCLGVWVQVSNIAAGQPGGWTSVAVAVTNESWPQIHISLAAVWPPLVSPQRMLRAPQPEPDHLPPLVDRFLDNLFGIPNTPPQDQPVTQGAHLATTLWTQPVAGASWLAVMVRLPPRRLGALRGPSIAFLVPGPQPGALGRSGRC